MKKSYIKSEKNVRNRNICNIFVHGLAGWGSYDKRYKRLPYWGMLNGDIIKYLNSVGFSCYSASVNPFSSAWDRACELYAQIAGTRVDYGKAHSEKMKHERYGTDYSSKPLITNKNEISSVNFIAHSFGGTTVRMLIKLLAEGSEEEKSVTAPNELSDLFSGGRIDKVSSVITLATPHNGTTAYMTETDSKILPLFFSFEKDGRNNMDYAEYDMGIDRALELNEQLSLQKQIYYFSYPCCVTQSDINGFQIPDILKTERIFRMKSEKMGQFTGKTEKGFEITEKWFKNDGLVNTVSATAPFNQPSKQFDRNNVQAGIWNIMPEYYGDHMSVTGGILKKCDMRNFYAELLDFVSELH